MSAASYFSSEHEVDDWRDTHIPRVWPCKRWRFRRGSYFYPDNHFLFRLRNSRSHTDVKSYNFRWCTRELDTDCHKKIGEEPTRISHRLWTFGSSNTCCIGWNYDRSHVHESSATVADNHFSGVVLGDYDDKNKGKVRPDSAISLQNFE